MKVSFDDVFNKTKLIRDINESLSSSFRKSKWDDEVHSSYEKYLKQCNEYFMFVQNSCRYLDEIANRLANLPNSEDIANDIKRLNIELAGI